MVYQEVKNYKSPPVRTNMSTKIMLNAAILLAFITWELDNMQIL